MRTSWRTLFLVLLLLGGSGVLVSWMVRKAVDNEISWAEGNWSLRIDQFPPWFPAGFQGELTSLADLPGRMSLRSVRWRKRLRVALEGNPWIDRVEGITRSGTRIEFRGRFLRPVVAVRAAHSFLLVSSTGGVIDHQQGDEIDPAWTVPVFVPEQDFAPTLAPGESLQGDEYDELLELLAVLWEARVFERWPGVISEIIATTRSEGDVHWYLRLRNSVPLRWGRAPDSELPSALTVDQKLRNLRQTLAVWRRLDQVGEVDLCSDLEPLVIRPQS